MEPFQKEHAQAQVKMFEEICQVRPTSQTLAHLAACYFTLERTEEALPLSLASWDKRRVASTGMTLGLILKDLGRHDESLAVMHEVYMLDQDDPYIRMGYAEGLLKAGFCKQGWPLYDNARLTQQGAAMDLRLPSSVKEWNGEALPEGHVLMVINEGGAGDRFSYARYLPELSKRGINWKFYPYAELFSFFERVFPRDRILSDGQELVPDPTHWTTTFALPAKLNVGPTEIPKPLSFTATPESVEKHRFNLPSDGLPLVGICYEAAEQHQGGRKVRSITEGQAMRLVCMTGDKVHWVNLQHGKPMPYPVTNFPFQTWEDTAGLIHNLDAVVTVDTGTMHLAGGMNKPLAVLLPANSCWKFGRAGKKLKLYPSATFYRNPDRGFETAISELIQAIRNGSAW